MSWFLFQFYDVGRVWLGACAVDGDHAMHALERSWRIGCASAGQVSSVELPGPPAEAFQRVALTKAMTDAVNLPAAQAAGCPF